MCIKAASKHSKLSRIQKAHFKLNKAGKASFSKLDHDRDEKDTKFLKEKATIVQQIPSVHYTHSIKENPSLILDYFVFQRLFFKSVYFI